MIDSKILKTGMLVQNTFKDLGLIVRENEVLWLTGPYARMLCKLRPGYLTFTVVEND